MSPLKLSYLQPALLFNEALPLGNGRMGAMFHGGLTQEIIHFNEDTLWSGYRAPAPRPAASVLSRVRRLLSAGDYVAAQRLVEEQMLGPFTQSYLPAGDLVLTMDKEEHAVGYHRELDLRDALGHVSYTTPAGPREREMFCSAAHQVFVMRLSAGRSSGLGFHLALRSLLRHVCEVAENGIELRGQCPVEALWPPVYGKNPPQEPIRYEHEGERLALRFALFLRVVSSDGDIRVEGSELAVAGASEATILVAISTSFHHVDPPATCRAWLDQAAATAYAELNASHLENHRHFFDRVELTLGESSKMDAPTDERLRRHATTADPALEALLFHYGRYLLIASSRPGTQPANLQGIWNHLLEPPWWSNLTLNINAEMNYWPAEVCHLSECHEPLLRLVGELAARGRNTARVQYGCAGWVAHHQTDLWRLTTPVGWMENRVNYGAALYAMWPLGGAWLCRHLWEHYLYGGDSKLLREQAWPAMKGAAEFFLDWLIENDDGQLVTAPSTSPENRFLLPGGDSASVCTNSTMDRSILRDLFGSVLEAAKVLGEAEEDFCRRVREAQDRLAPLQIGKRGQIMEWEKDWEEGEPRHRHLSQLYGLYPAAEIDPQQTPGLAEAARRTLDLRGDEGTGWSLAWKINLRARLGDGDHAHTLIRRMLTMVNAETTELVYADAPGGVYPNLLCAHPPFQIDGNFGVTAGMAEMLVQSHRQSGERHVIELLPALPRAWPTGKFSGLRGRGGFEISAEWTDGRLQRATVLSTRGGPLRVRVGATWIDYETRIGQQIEIDAFT